MARGVKSAGKCIYCDKLFDKSGVHRHLKAHLHKAPDKNIAGGVSYLLKVEPDGKFYGSSPLFLSLWVDGDTSLTEIDEFLRAIWLECCGHSSAFSVAKREVPMNKKASEVFDLNPEMEYAYDFGSSTYLVLKVVERFAKKADENIVLLSRNEPPKIFCQMCKKNLAVQICTVHNWNEADLFCAKCAKKHAKKCFDFEYSAAMPLVNSPRAGICGYDGGRIDIERDGVSAKK